MEKINTRNNKVHEWTEEEIEYLRKAWSSNMAARAISKELNRSSYSIYVMAHKLNLPKKEAPNKIKLSQSDIHWLKSNYPHIRTEICATMLGISSRSCIRIARRLGLGKTAQFMRETQAVTTKKAQESHLRNGTYPAKGYYSPNLQKGVPYQFKSK